MNYSYHMHQLISSASATASLRGFNLVHKWSFCTCIPPNSSLSPVLSEQMNCYSSPLPPASPTRTLALYLSLCYISVQREYWWNEIAVFFITIPCGFISSPSFSLSTPHIFQLRFALCKCSRCFNNGLWAHWQANGSKRSQNQLHKLLMVLFSSLEIREFLHKHLLNNCRIIAAFPSVVADGQS